MIRIKVLLFLFIVPVFVFGQKQVKIDWPSLANSPWPVLRGDVQGTGRSEFIGPRSLNIAWQKDMPYGILRGPVIGYNDNLYMGTDLLGDSVNHFFAVDHHSKDLWTFNTPGYVPNNGGPILAKDSTIYFFSANQYLYALNKDGSLKWKVNIWANLYPQLPMDLSGNLYVPVKDTLCVISPDGFISNKIYLPKIGPALSFSVGGDTIFALIGPAINYGQTGNLSAIDLSGNILWTYSFPYHNAGIPLVDNQNKIYVFGADTTKQCFLYCLKPNGTVDWKYSVPSIYEGYTPTMNQNGNIVFFNERTVDNIKYGVIISLDYSGHEKWVTPLDGDWWHNWVSLGLVCDAEGKIYGGGTAPGGNFYCLDSNGVILWKYTSGIFEYDSCPAIGSDGTLYIGFHNDGSVLCTQNLIAIKDSITSVNNDGVENIKEYQLLQNYPNPFNPNTKIIYQIPKSGLVMIIVFDILGNQVATLVNQYKSKGNYEVNFNAAKFSSGVYFYQIRVNDFVSSKKMVFTK